MGYHLRPECLLLLSSEWTERGPVRESGAFCTGEGEKNFLVAAKKEISVFLLLQWYGYAAGQAVCSKTWQRSSLRCGAPDKNNRNYIEVIYFHSCKSFVQQRLWGSQTYPYQLLKSSSNAADAPAKWLQRARAVPGLRCHQHTTAHGICGNHSLHWMSLLVPGHQHQPIQALELMLGGVRKWPLVTGGGQAGGLQSCMEVSTGLLSRSLVPGCWAILPFSPARKHDGELENTLAPQMSTIYNWSCFVPLYTHNAFFFFDCYWSLNYKQCNSAHLNILFE